MKLPFLLHLMQQTAVFSRTISQQLKIVSNAASDLLERLAYNLLRYKSVKAAVSCSILPVHRRSIFKGIITAFFEYIHALHMY
jgi:hypothetical protein